MRRPASLACCLGKFPLITVVCGLVLGLSQSAFAQGSNCVQDEFTAAGNSQTLGCTANDVQIAKVTNVRDLTGKTLTTCDLNSTFSFIADFEIVTTSKSSRSNIGLYIATNSTTQALTGSCVDNIIAPPHTCPSGLAGCGSDNYHELDASPDSCGDTSSTDVSPTFGAGAEKVTLEIDGFSCTPPAGSTDNTLVLPNCTSWQVPGKTLLCVSSPPSFPFVPTGAIPGTSSKCNCSVISLPIRAQTPQVSVAKSCNTSLTTGTGQVSCDAGAEGSDVTYNVVVTNKSTFGDIAVDQVCDTAYGTVYRSQSAPSTLAACAAGTITGGTINSTTCDFATMGDIATTGNCNFIVHQGEIASVTDTVSVSGHGLVSGTFGPSTSNSVTVVSEDAPSTAEITKGFDSNTNLCATVRYNVDVHNSSGGDETLTLSALNDDHFGDITKWTGTGNAAILGTTCGVAIGSKGLGSLSGVTASSTNGGALLAGDLPQGGADYKCQFDANFCSAPTTINLPGGGTCTGIQHINTVSGTIVGDESEAVTQTDHQFTVNECITTSSSSQ